MTNSKDLSIVVPCFNQEKYLERFFYSISKVNVKDKTVEIIFVNDGSYDDTEKIIKSNLSKSLDEKIVYKYLTQKNSGVSSARNLGIMNAIGEFIWFVDPDDELGIFDLDLVIQRMKKEGIEILLMGFDIMKDAQLSHSIRYGSLKYDPNKNFKNLIASHTIESVWNKIFKRDLLTRNNILFPIGVHMAEDFFFVIKAFSASNKIYFSNINSYSYHLNSGSLMGRYQYELKSLRCKIFKIYMNYCLINNLNKKEVIGVYIKDTFISVVLNSMKNKDNGIFDVYFESKKTINQCLKVVSGNMICGKVIGLKNNIFKILFNFKMHSILIIFIMIFYSV